MARNKVFEVAKQFAISPVALLRKLKEMGSSATSPMSVVEPAVLSELEKSFQEQRAARRKKTGTRRKSTPAASSSGTQQRTRRKKTAAAAAEAEKPKAEKPKAEVTASASTDSGAADGAGAAEARVQDVPAVEVPEASAASAPVLDVKSDSSTPPSAADAESGALASQSAAEVREDVPSTAPVPDNLEVPSVVGPSVAQEGVSTAADALASETAVSSPAATGGLAAAEATASTETVPAVLADLELDHSPSTAETVSGAQARDTAQDADADRTTAEAQASPAVEAADDSKEAAQTTADVPEKKPQLEEADGQTSKPANEGGTDKGAAAEKTLQPAEPTKRRVRVIPAPRQTARILYRPTTPVAATPPPKPGGGRFTGGRGGDNRSRGGRTGGYRTDALPTSRDRFGSDQPAAGRTGDRSASVAGAVSRRAEKKRKKRQSRQTKTDTRAVKESVRKTFAEMSKGDRRKKRKRDRDEEAMVENAEPRVIQMAEFATVSELASALQIGENEVILQLFNLGVIATRNQRLEMDTITMIAEGFGVTVQPLAEIGEDRFEEEVDEGGLEPRHPIVTVMGHVDHGKTSLLDQIRRSNVVRGEKGGITQHIGAYEVETARGRITFMDTPGHEAFTAMRMRGAQVTDLVVLVVAADDGVMPQTVEAIDHAKAAKVPLVVAINKCDLPASNPLRVKQMLTEHNLVVEDFGGSTQAVEVSAKKGTGLDRLLETILLEAEMLELQANPNRRADGVVVEAFLDRGKGPVATVLVQQGTLRPGDAVIAGLHNGRVRALLDERDQPMDSAGPASPAKVLGLSGVPQAGDVFHVVRDEREAREIAAQRGAAKRTSELKRAKVTLDSFLSQVQQQGVRDLPIIVKGDGDGSVEALSDSLERLSNDEVRVEVIRRGVGGITESDVMLAGTSSAVIIGFHVRPGDRARALAAQERVDIRLYDVIYDAVADVRMALEGLLAPELREQVDGVAEVREVFKVPKVGLIAGCHVLSGKITRNSKARIVRDGVMVFDSTIASLRRFKDDAREVAEGFECGIGIDRFNDIKMGDRIEAYSVAEIARKLESN
jgi:translation initiation factor IF-2